MLKTRESIASIFQDPKNFGNVTNEEVLEENCEKMVRWKEGEGKWGSKISNLASKTNRITAEDLIRLFKGEITRIYERKEKLYEAERVLHFNPAQPGFCELESERMELVQMQLHSGRKGKTCNTNLELNPRLLQPRN